MQENQTSEHIRQKRRAIVAERRRRRIRAFAWYGLLAEVFLLPLSAGAAEIALLIASVATGIRLKTEPDFSFRHLPFDVPALLFVIISALSVLASPDRAFSFYNYYNLVGVYVLTYFVAGQNVRRAGQMKTLLLTAGIAAAFVIVYGYYQFLFGIDISAMKWVDGDAFPELRKRVFSTWENPNILAGYLDIVICLAFGLFMHSNVPKKRMIFGVFMLAAAACLAMTYARGACLVIAVILAGYGAIRDRRVLLACVVIGGLLLAADPVLYERLTSVFTKVDTSTEMRLAFWESTVAMIQDHPFLGIGWGAYWMVYPEYDFYLQGANVLIVHAHNIYLNYMAEIGIPGAVAFFWFFFGTMFLSLRLSFAADDPQEERLLRGSSLGLGLAVLSIALNGLTDDLLFNMPSSMVLWLMAALTGSLSFLSQPAAGSPFVCLQSFGQRILDAGRQATDKAAGLTREKENPDEEIPAEKVSAEEAKKSSSDAEDDHPALPPEDAPAVQEKKDKKDQDKDQNKEQENDQSEDAANPSEAAAGEAGQADETAAAADVVQPDEGKQEKSAAQPEQEKQSAVKEAKNSQEEAAHEGSDKHIQGDH